ncbi:MAG TPA: substrate-binding domain-containing protein, partial [Polyangiaceae bacterium]|nr:substrate-binding domain-containing protein [Polyangiaceae bacterium]
GHRKIAFIGGPRVSLDSQHRLAGLREGLGEMGIRLPESHVVFAARYHSDEGRAHALRWLGLGSQAPTAVVLGNDTMAIGFMSTLQAHGVVIPDQVSVVGFDDGPAASWVWPRLTTARQEARTLGLLACRSLVRQLENSDLEPHSVTELPMPLIIRESTGPASPTRRRRRSR